MTPSSFGTLNPTLVGYFVQDAQDALAIIQLVLEGKLSLAHRRPKDPERQYVIKSGNVFVFKEMKGHIQRWTDGITWSASRILTPFLVYRQDSKAPIKSESVGSVQKKSGAPSGGNRSMKSSHSTRPSKSRKTSSVESLPGPMAVSMDPNSMGVSNDYYSDNGYFPRVGNTQMPQLVPHSGHLSYQHAHMSSSTYQNDHRSLIPQVAKSVVESRDIDYELFGSLKDAHFAEDGLAKKTISVKYQGVPYRLISYFTKPDVTEGRLKRPSDEPMFRNIVIEKELWESVQENKTPLDMTELYYPSNAPHGQYTGLTTMQTYSGYPPPPIIYGRPYQQDPGTQRLTSDSPHVFPNAEEHGGRRRNIAEHNTFQGAALTHNQQINMYPQASPSALPAQQWYGTSTAYGAMPGGGIPYGHIMRTPDEQPASGIIRMKPSKNECDMRPPPTERGISDLYLAGNFEDPARYGPPPTDSSLHSDTVPSSSGHHTLTQTLKHQQPEDYDANNSGQSGRAGLTQNSTPEAVKQQVLSDTLSVNSQIAESLEEPNSVGQNQDILSSISPGSSPLEPSIRTGISATTFISPNYEYCDPDDAHDDQSSRTVLEHHANEQPVDYRPQYPTQSHGTPSATQSKANPNIYFSTGRAWS